MSSLKKIYIIEVITMIAISVIFFVKEYKWFSATLFILGLSIIVYNNHLVKKSIEKSKTYLTKSRYIHDLRRNFECMIVGGIETKNEKVKKWIASLPKNRLDYTSEGRGIDVTFLIVATFFSLVKEGGVIYYLYSQNQLYNDCLTTVDTLVLGPVLLDGRSKIELKLRHFFPLLFCIPIYKKNRYTLLDLKNFCEERGLAFKSIELKDDSLKIIDE